MGPAVFSITAGVARPIRVTRNAVECEKRKENEKKSVHLVGCGRPGPLRVCALIKPALHGKDLVFDPALVGVWAEEADSDTWAFEKDGDKAYKLVVTEKGDAREFKVHLAKLGPLLFLDFYPQDSLREVRQDFFKAHLVPAYLFARVRQIVESLQFSFLNPDWLSKLLKEQP